MLHGRHQQPIERALPGAQFHERRKRQPIRLGAAGGEDHAAWLGADQCGHLLARLLDDSARRAALAMHG